LGGRGLMEEHQPKQKHECLLHLPISVTSLSAIPLL
jgi:hypothetical protein